MKAILLDGEAKEIAALVVELQEQQCGEIEISTDGKTVVKAIRDNAEALQG